MSLVYGGYIPRNGLIAYMDITNRGKCWLGVPSTNSVLYSNDFAMWNRSGGTDIVPAIWEIGPTGQQNAKRVTANGTAGAFIHRNSDSPVAAGETLTKSIYAKAGTLNTIISEFYDNGGFQTTTFNIAGGAITQNAAGNTPSIEACGNGWYRCSVTRTFTNAGHAGVWYIGVYGTSPAGYIFLYGAQHEIRNGASRLIETNGTALARPSVLVDLVDRVQYTRNSLLYTNDSFTFNNNPQYLQKPITSTFFRDSSWTVTAVVKFYTVNKGQDNLICRHMQSNDTNMNLHLVERQAKLYYGFYANDFQASALTILANTPYIVHFTYNPTTLKQEIYVNGALIAERTTGTAYQGVAPQFEVGLNLHGELPLFMLHNRVLSASEINTLFVTNKIKFGL